MSPSGRILVLGGTGFVGRAVCRALYDAGTSVVAVARGGRTGTPTTVHRQDLSAATIGDLRALLHAYRPTVVVNAAGTPFGESEDELAATQRDLVGLLVDVLSDLPWQPRLVQIGTVHEYGPVGDGVRIAEDHPVAPTSPYGRIKAEASRKVLDAARDEVLDGVVLRVSNAVGPGIGRGSLFGIVTAELAAAASGGPRRLELRPMTARRDFVDIRDVADAVVRAAAAPVTGHVLNIGSGHAAGVRDLVRELVEISGAPLRIDERSGDGGAGAALRSGGSDWIELDTTLARELLGWHAAHTVRDALCALWASEADATARKATG